MTSLLLLSLLLPLLTGLGQDVPVNHLVIVDKNRTVRVEPCTMVGETVR